MKITKLSQMDKFFNFATTHFGKFKPSKYKVTDTAVVTGQAQTGQIKGARIFTDIDTFDETKVAKLMDLLESTNLNWDIYVVPEDKVNYPDSRCLTFYKSGLTKDELMDIMNP